MKLNKLKYIIPIALLGVVLWSCDESDNTGDSELTPNNPTVDITALSNSFTIDEADTTFVITATLSEAAIVDISLDVNTSGTATEDEDYELSTHQMMIPRGSLTATMEVTILADEVTAEEDETLVVSIGDNTNANAQITTTDFTWTLNNTPDFAVNSYITLVASWDNGETTVAGDSYCDAFDVDVILQNETGTVDLSYAMATGACPEEGNWELGDGTYRIGTALFDAPDLGDYAVDIPITLTLYRLNNDGSIAAQTGSITVTNFTSDDADGGVTVYEGAYLVASGGTVELQDASRDSTGEVKIKRKPPVDYKH